MTTTMIRITCSSCQVDVEVPTTSLVLTLPPVNADAAAEPALVFLCPGCRACESTAITWRTAAFLLEAGGTVLASPDIEHFRPRYPERRPASDGPMTLDDLIDLHAALNSDAYDI